MSTLNGIRERLTRIGLELQPDDTPDLELYDYLPRLVESFVHCCRFGTARIRSTVDPHQEIGSSGFSVIQVSGPENILNKQYRTVPSQQRLNFVQRIDFNYVCFCEGKWRFPIKNSLFEHIKKEDP